MLPSVLEEGGEPTYICTKIVTHIVPRANSATWDAQQQRMTVTDFSGRRKVGSLTMDSCLLFLFSGHHTCQQSKL